MRRNSLSAQLAVLLLIGGAFTRAADAQLRKGASSGSAPPFSASIDSTIQAMPDAEATVDGTTEVGEDSAVGEESDKQQDAETDTRRTTDFVSTINVQKRRPALSEQQFDEPTADGRDGGGLDVEYYNDDDALAARLAVEEDVDRLAAEGDFGGRQQLLAHSEQPAAVPVAPPSFGRGQEGRLVQKATTTGTTLRVVESTLAAIPSEPPTLSYGKPSRNQQVMVAPSSSIKELPKPMLKTKEINGLSELDVKSDWGLAKLMRRTTLSTRNYPSEDSTRPVATTTPLPLLALAASQAPSLVPGVLFPFPYSSLGPASQPNRNSPPSSASAPYRRSTLRAEQFEQLGCGWDLMTQSCRDVFRVGWCEGCTDFGHGFLHDCRCTAVTGLYVQTATFLGSSAANARANAALVANQTSGTAGTVATLPMLPGLSLLPTLAQLGGGPVRAEASPKTTASPMEQVQQTLADALRLPVPSTPATLLGGIGIPAQQQQQQQSFTSLLLPPSPSSQSPPAVAFGEQQFGSGPIFLPQFGTFGRRR